MYNKSLESFVKVAETGSFSKAAELLFVSRPALIQQMNLLESRLGFKLFVRSNRGVTLTEAGHCFYNGVTDLIRRFDAVMRRCLEFEEVGRDTLRIGSLPNFTPVVLPRICRRYCELYPQVRLQFIEYPLESYFKGFADDKFDITTEYMSGYMFDEPGYQFVKLAEDRHCCGISPAHPLAARERIRFSDLRGKKLVLYAKGITRADDMLREYLGKHEPTVEMIDITTYSSSLSIKCELEDCILIYYSMYWQSFPTLVTLPVEWNFPIDIGLGYKSNPRPAVRRFIALAEEMFQSA